MRNPWTTLPVPDARLDGFRDIERGPDGAVYTAEASVQGLSKVTSVSQASRAAFVSLGDFYPTYMASGSDGNLYINLFNQTGGHYVGSFTTAGSQIALYDCDPTPAGDTCSVGNLTRGPDGSVWFCEYHHVASISPQGKFAEYSIEGITMQDNESPTIVVGPDGKLWFTVWGAIGVSGFLASIEPVSQKIAAYPLPYPACIQTRGLAVGADSSLYVACETDGSGSVIARVTTRGNVTTIPYQPGFASFVTTMAGGSDGKVYFSSAAAGGGLADYDPRAKIVEFRHSPIYGVGPLMAGPDGTIWGGVNTIGIDIYRVPKR